jgi:hypothetical protein
MNAALPNQTGNSGKFVTTDGTTASWAAALPSQIGNSGKLLTTNGSAASWTADNNTLGSVVLAPPFRVENAFTDAQNSVYLKTGVQVSRADAVTAGWDVTALEAMGLSTPVQTSVNSLVTSAVVFGNGIFVGAGATNVYKSTDGITWVSTIQTSIGRVWFLNGLFIVQDAGYTTLYTSPNAVTWTAVTHPFSGANCTFGYAGGYYSASIVSAFNISISTDLNTWSTGNTVAGTSGRVTYGAGLFIIPRATGVPIAWSHTANVAGYVPGFSSAYIVKYVNGKFIALTNTTTGYTSPDGITWTSNSTSIGASAGHDWWGGGRSQLIAYNGTNTYVAIGASYPMTSPDGAVWTQRASTISGPIAFLGTKFFIFGSTANAGYSLQYSTDGITWPATDASLASSYICSVTYSGSVYVCIGRNTAGTAGEIWSSTTGIAWTNRLSLAGASFDSVEYGGGMFVAAGNGKLYSSPDGTSWTSRTATLGATYPTVFYINSLWILCNPQTTNCLYTSPDGIVWTLRVSSTPGGAVRAYAAYYTNGVYSVFYDGGGLRYSYDGISWAGEPDSSVAVYCTVQNGGINLLTGASTTGSGAIAAVASSDGRAYAPMITGASPVLGTMQEGPVFGGSVYWVYGTILYKTPFPSGATTVVSLVNLPGGTPISSGTRLVTQGSTAIQTSTDGVTWTSSLSASVASYGAYGNGTFVFIGASGYPHTSSDGTTGRIGYPLAVTGITNAAPYLRVK